MLRPLFPWVGGKQHILKELLHYVPHQDQYNVYIEPFLGAGSMLLALQPETAIVNDLNPWVFMIWHLCSHHPEFLIKESIKVVKKQDAQSKMIRKQYYYDKLRFFNDHYSSAEKDIPKYMHSRQKCHCSAKLLQLTFIYYYLIRGAFGAKVFFDNHGKLVCHYGDLPLSTLCSENFISVHFYLTSNNIHFYNGPYQHVLKNLKDRAFIYLDPPYHDSNVSHGVAKYHATQTFGDDEYVELYHVLEKLSKRHLFMQSNTYNQYISQLFKRYPITCFDIQRSLANKHVAGKRKLAECIIRNYQ